jgi:polyisoprenoid-binding protein YceI
MRRSAVRYTVIATNRTAGRVAVTVRRKPMVDWQLDPYHTQVEFSAKHLGMMTVRGHFADVNSMAQIDPDHPESSSIDVTIQTASIRTHNETRDNDLRGSNFLEVEKFPTIGFTSTELRATGDDHYTLTGDLTIKNITHPVTLNAFMLGEFNDPMMGHRIGYNATGKINRRYFGVTLNVVLDGRFVVSDEIQISIEGELVEKTEVTADSSSA